VGRSGDSEDYRLKRRWIAIVLIAVALVACSPSVVTPTGSRTPTTSPGKPVVECEAGLDQTMCEKALEAVLVAVAPSGWTPTQVWIGSGSMGPTVNFLFDPKANFPAPSLPDGGTNFGSAEVAFAETSVHAGMNLAAVGSGMVADLIGYAIPRPDWCSGLCPASSFTYGHFRLDV
jgi:hypothetical protein